MVELELNQDNFWQSVISFIILLIFSYWVISEYKKKDFFKYPLTPSLLKIKGEDVLKGFGLVVLTEGVVAPLILAFINHYFKLFQPGHVQIWISLFATFAGAWMAFIAFKQLTKLQQHLLFKQLQDSTKNSIQAGLQTLLLFYLPVMLLSALLTALVSFLFGQLPKDQVAIEFIRQAKNYPVQLILTLIAVTILAPFKEEFLFRGLLQSWLKQKFHNRTAAIIITSIIFALFHYASSQEWSNIVLFCALFFLSYGLGFVFEKQRSLWASIVMHAGFNLSQVIIFLLVE